MEYPGYGVYQLKDSPIFGDLSIDNRAQQILEDAEAVYKYVRDVCRVKETDIIVSGRSIGSGPACYTASKFNPHSLVLISPIKSVKEVAMLKYGRLADILINERFDNFKAAQKVNCPAVVFHGLLDHMVPY